MTSIEKSLTRLCPDIKDDQDRELTVTIQPSDQGGEILFHWNGDRKKSGDRTFQFAALIKGDTSAPRPKGWGTWVGVERIMAMINIAPGINPEMAKSIHGLMERAAMMQLWLEEDAEIDDFNEFLESKGRKDLVHLPCDDETPEASRAREKSAEARAGLATRRSKLPKIPPPCG